jgi:glycosyltransferase domain-containing protein
MKKKLIFHIPVFLVLIKDEEYFSKKLINHINSHKPNAEFIIADGSKRAQKKIFKKLNTKYKYYYFGEDKNLSIFFQKILKGINKCTNQFIFLCDQDDLVNFKIVNLHEKFLNKNKTYSTAKGIVYDFEYLKYKINLLRKYNNDFKDNKTFLMRYFFNPNFRAYYCLHRKKNLKNIFKLINKYKINDVRSVNFLMNIITLSSGRIKFYDDISVLRWSGVKMRDKNKTNNHFVCEIHKNRYQWFNYFFSENTNLIKKILINKKIFFQNILIFKVYFFIFDILMNKLKKIINKVRINKTTKKSNELYKKYNLQNIISKNKIIK